MSSRAWGWIGAVWVVLAALASIAGHRDLQSATSLIVAYLSFVCSEIVRTRESMNTVTRLNVEIPYGVGAGDGDMTLKEARSRGDKS